MSRILAFQDQSPSGPVVARLAQALGEILGFDVETLTFAVSSDKGRKGGATAAALLDRVRFHNPELVVLGSRALVSKPEPVGHVAMDVLSRLSVPVAVIPPHCRNISTDSARVLFPLDALPETDEALGPTAERLRDAGAAIVILHSFDSESVPPFLGSSYDVAALAEEFADRHMPSWAADCELRIGSPASHIQDLVISDDIDLVVVAWRRDFSPGRAEVFRQLLRDLDIPVIAVPILPGIDGCLGTAE